MAISGSQQAYTFARSGIARSGATRSNYVGPFATVELIVRGAGGGVVSRTDITSYIRYGSLQVTQALNDEADTCSFQIVPTAPAAAVPTVGQEVTVAWTPGAPVFQGYALVVQFDRRPMNQSPWVSVQCQDAMWRFDARLVTYRFPTQSVTASIAHLVMWFCNDPTDARATDFTTAFVQPNMPHIPAFDVVNQRPSTVMRRLMGAVAGAFYVIGRDLHAWAGSLSEPQQSNPQPLINTLASLKAFRVTHDATQLRKRVLVEGQRAATLIPYPTMSNAASSSVIGVPLTDARIFPPTPPAPGEKYLVRFGSQWMLATDPIVAVPNAANPPQARTQQAFTPGDTTLSLKAVPANPLPPARGWIRVGGQLTRYSAISGNPASETWSVQLPPATFPYGVLTVPVPVDEPVEWVDGLIGFEPRGLLWTYPTSGGDTAVRTQSADTPVVTLAEASRARGDWPGLEGFVQDGRYSYEGALARAEADLDAFAEPLVTVDWETEDLNAQPGRPQPINLTGTSVMDPLVLTVTITRVEIAFLLRTQLPRRRCVGGAIKPSTFLDLVLTDES